MRVGDIIRIVNNVGSQSLGGLELQTGMIVACSPKGSTPSFWLVELNSPQPSAIKRVGGWAGVAINGSFLRRIN